MLSEKKLRPRRISGTKKVGLDEGRRHERLLHKQKATGGNVCERGWWARQKKGGKDPHKKLLPPTKEDLCNDRVQKRGAVGSEGKPRSSRDDIQETRP